MLFYKHYFSSFIVLVCFDFSENGPAPNCLQN